MKKAKLVTLLLVFTMALTLIASAATPRYAVTAKCSPSLRISGTTASCEAIITADSGASISGTMTLYRVSGSKTEVASWSISGTTNVNLAKTTGVTKGQTYQLVLNVTVSGSGGTDRITKDVTATCN